MENKKNISNIHQKMLKIFPWISDIKREFSRSFPSDYQEYSLNLLNKKIQNELEEFSLCLSKRAIYLYEMLEYFYNHFCWKVKWNESSQHMQVTCIQLLANLVKVGIFLSRGNVKSLWLDRILAAIMIFSGPSDHLYTALLCVNVLKKKHLNVYSAILRNILCFNHLTTKEPDEYLKVMLLFRRLKSLVKDPIKNGEIAFAIAKVKPPASLKSWLRAHDFEVLWHVKSKIILKKLMKKSLDKLILRRLREVILPEMCLENIFLRSKNKQMKLDAPDLSVIDRIRQVQTESEMTIADYNESYEVTPSSVKKSKKEEKENHGAIGRENVMIKLSNVDKSLESIETMNQAYYDEEGQLLKFKKSKTGSDTVCFSNKNHPIVMSESKMNKHINVESGVSLIRTVEAKLHSNEMSYEKENFKCKNIIGIEIKASNDKSLSTDLYDVNKDSIEQNVSGEKKHISDHGKSIKSSNNFELHDKTSLHEDSPKQRQATNKPTVQTRSCSPSLNRNELKNDDVNVKDLLADKDSLNLQIETKDEIVKNCEDRDEAVIEKTGESILEYVGLRLIPTTPILEASSKKNLLNDYDSNKLISVRPSRDFAETKPGNHSIEINKSEINIARSNSNEVINSCSLKNNDSNDKNSSHLMIVKNSNENEADTLPNSTVDYIMEKMLKRLEQADNAVEDCSFETLKHNVLKSAIKITPNKSFVSNVMNNSNLESSPLLKKASNMLSFLDVSLEKSCSNEPKTIRHHTPEASKFSLYRDLIHDLDDNKSEDTLSGNQITNKTDTNESSSDDGSNKRDENYFSSDDCSYDSDVVEINESTHDCNSCDRQDTFHVKNNFSGSGQDFASRTSKEREDENVTSDHIQEMNSSENDNINSVKEYSNVPKVDSNMEFGECKRLSPVVDLGEKCDSENFSKNNSKILNCVDIVKQLEFDLEAKNNNSYNDSENMIPQENQKESCDLQEKIIEDIHKKIPYVIVSNICCVEEPSNPKVDTPRSPLHLADMSLSSVSKINDSLKSENADDHNQVNSGSSELAEHDHVIESSLSRKLRKRTNQTTSIKDSVPVGEKVHIKPSDTKKVESPVKLACYTSLRNRNTTPLCKNLRKGSIESMSSASSSVRRSSKRLKKEVNHNLGLALSVLSLDSPKTKKCSLKESSIKNIPEEELKDLVPVDSETKTPSSILNKEKRRVCKKSSLFKAVSNEVDSQKSSNQETNSKGYNLRARSIIMPGKLKL